MGGTPSAAHWRIAVDREVDHELGRERRDVDRPVVQARSRLPGEAEDDRRPDRVPGVRGAGERRAAGEARPRTYSSALPQQNARRHRERNHPDREQEEHRDEDQLRRDGRAARDLEVEAKRECVGADQQRDGETPTGRAPTGSARPARRRRPGTGRRETISVARSRVARRSRRRARRSSMTRCASGSRATECVVPAAVDMP